MRCPPVEWEDLWANGLAANAEISCDGSNVSVSPGSSRLAVKLLAAAAASPPPEGDRIAYLRHVRDLLMGCTDWTQANDSPLTEAQRAAWATYRQSLRDLPETYSGDGPIPWPVAPAL